MSRIGRRIIQKPNGVEVKIDQGIVTVKGPKGVLSQKIPEGITIVVEGSKIKCLRSNDSKVQRSMHGMMGASMSNMITGLTTGFTKELEMIGVGYRVAVQGKDLQFQLGHSHPIIIKALEGITFGIDGQTKVKVQGANREQVGEIAAQIRKLRGAEPYKGKGIRYIGETIRRKAGKSAKK